MKTNKLPNLVVILILTLVTVATWISFSVYRALTEKPAPVVEKTVSEPLNPRLDVDTINKIKSGIFLDSSQIPQNVVSQTATNQPLSVATPIVFEATPSATPAGQ